MLNLFRKKKRSLVEIIPFDFIDIHSHLLPGIDDGAKSLDDSIELITRMSEFGINNFITTPHVLGNIWPNTSDTILDAYDLLTAELEKRGMDHIKIDAAAEYMLDEEFCKILASRDLLTLRDDTILVEMSFLNAPVNLFEMLFDLQLNGYRPILAHPERYFFYHNRFEVYDKLKKAGCRFQVNALSFTGYYGDFVKKVAEKLLKLNMIDFIGTDTHSHKHLDMLENLANYKNIDLLKPIFENNRLFLK